MTRETHHTPAIPSITETLRMSCALADQRRDDLADANSTLTFIAQRQAAVLARLAVVREHAEAIKSLIVAFESGGRLDLQKVTDNAQAILAAIGEAS